MPSADFFRNFNLFILKEFLDRACCESLLSEFRKRPASKSQLTRGLDEDVRRSQEIDLRESVGPSIRAGLRELKPKVESHFDLKLHDCEHPQFLSYGVGDFFRPHSDGSASPDAAEYLRRRRVSVVVFLNDRRNDNHENDFDGGDLVLYGLMKEPEWVNCGLPVAPEAGLLIAFPSDIEHEVRPVTAGRRFSIASWYYAR